MWSMITSRVGFVRMKIVLVLGVCRADLFFAFRLGRLGESTTGVAGVRTIMTMASQVQRVQSKPPTILAHKSITVVIGVHGGIHVFSVRL